ncbi:type II toxin-antitoxin system RelE/ParE family toxin [Microvirga massiliensis]|uniref:type II toxin-antitoxin system RelE/ParE family toxin n=1 Tax=Microvirga massiliensis TaxID=1033741 RepID=UPI00062B9014|nr:type II toxin-antitoxin system RelE/ParE family toxin [Microvirga massiliensis]
MHTVIQTPTFLADAKAAGLDDGEIAGIAAIIGANPLAGDIIPGTGGARKVRIGGKGRGKSGGYRVITYYAAKDVPVFLLALVDKGQRADISQADRNALRQILGTLADDYRKGVRAKVRRMRP